ncbi:MAG: YceI family protein [Planctomycetes bacterium]|nr:YceI family protein [Planctomycetota bacterium]
MIRSLIVVLAVAVLAPAARAQTYNVDLAHSSITFMIQHLGISFVHGRFNDFSGKFTVDKDAAKSSFEMTIKADSVDTNQKKRDEHLRSDTFFDAKKYPDMTFKSTKVEPIDGGYKVTGDFTMHGVTKSVTFDLKGGKTVEMKGVQRTGFSTAFILRRADFGISALPDGIANDVNIFIGFEGTKK